FHEDIPIPGTDVTLHYTSSRVTGYKPGVITVPASGDTVPESLIKIIVQATVAGKKYEIELPPEPNQVAEIDWDGLDYLGRTVNDSAVAHIGIGFVYYGLYFEPNSEGPAFGQTGTNSLTVPTRQEVTLWSDRTLRIIVGKGSIAEGWTISSQHHVNPIDPSVLYKGNGSIYQLDTNIITTVAGNENGGFSGDGGPATEASFSWIQDIAIDNTGNLYLADHQNHRIRKVDTNGIVTTVAGNGYNNPFNYVNKVTVDDSGNIYVAAGWWLLGETVYKVAVDGNISAVVGGRPPIGALLVGISGLAVDNSGNLYISTVGDVNYPNEHRILKVDASGIVTTVAGTGKPGFSGDGGLAINAKLKYPRRIALDREGNIFFADSSNHRIRKVDNSGIITTVAGTGESGFSGDGGQAVDAMLYYPTGVALDSDGSIYISAEYDYHIRKVDANGIITTVAGTGTAGFSGDGGPAILAQLDGSKGIGLDALGNLNIAFWGRVRMISMAKLLVPNMSDNDLGFPEKIGKGHIMNASGLHKETVDLNTGVMLSGFGYDADNNLISITDQFGNQITIERDADGVPTAVISPEGIRTELTIDENNQLKRVTYADGGFYDFEYTSDGLMLKETQPAGNVFEHLFDDKGRLTDILDGEEGHWAYGRTVDASSETQTEVLSAEGNLTTFLDRTDSTGKYTSTITNPAGALTHFEQSSDGLTENHLLPCGTDLEYVYDLDSQYKYPYAKQMTESTPA
ncbi:MAG: hypothetical protein P8Y99_16975, partial [Calditrichaceae bacterium]